MGFGAMLVTTHILLGYVIAVAVMVSPAALHTVVIYINTALFLLGFLALVRSSVWTGRARVYFQPDALIFCTLLVAFVCSFLYQGTEGPAQGWDSLDSWLFHASNVASQLEVAQGDAYFYEQRHPLTISALLALAGWLDAYIGNSAPSTILAAIPYVSLICVCFGYSKILEANYGLALMTILMLLSTPLAINHVLLFGYADLWLAAALVAAVALLSISLRSSDWKVFVLTAASLFALVSVKNTGLVFAVAIFAVATITKFRERVSASKVLGVAGVALVAFGFSVSSGSPKVESVFSVRFVDESLIFSKEDCTQAAFKERFLVDIQPADGTNLDTSRWVQAKYPNRDFRAFIVNPDDVRMEGSACSFSVAVEGYEPRAIRVGQLSRVNHPSWMGFLLPGAAYYEVPILGVNLQVGESLVIGVIGKYMKLNLSPPLDVIANAKTALLDNVSYSVFFSVLVLVTIFAAGSVTGFFHVENFVITVAWVLVLLLLFAQFIFVEFYNTSLPHNDTRYSRFMLWLPTLVCLAVYELRLHRR